MKTEVLGEMPLVEEVNFTVASVERIEFGQRGENYESGDKIITTDDPPQFFYVYDSFLMDEGEHLPFDFDPGCTFCCEVLQRPNGDRYVSKVIYSQTSPSFVRDLGTLGSAAIEWARSRVAIALDRLPRV